MLEAYWQFAEFRDEAGWKALEKATQKRKIDSFPLEMGQLNVAAHRVLFGRDLMWEEMTLYSPYMISLSSTNTTFGIGSLPSKFRKFFRWLVWEGMKQEKGGNSESALQMYDVTFQVASLIRSSAHGLLDNMIGTAFESIAISGPWEAGIKAKIDVDKSDKYYYSKQRIASFEQYARQHNQPKIARYSQLLNEHRRNDDKLSNVMNKASKSFIPQSVAGYILWRMGVLLLWILTGATIIGIIANLVLKVLLRGDREVTAYKETDFWRGAISFMAFPASLLLIIGYAALLYVALAKIDFYEEIINLTLFTSWNNSWMRIAVFAILTPMIFGIAYCWKRAARSDLQSPAKKVLLWQILGAIGSLLFVVYWAALATRQLPFPTGNKTLKNLFYIYIMGAPEVGIGEGNISIIYLSVFVVTAGILIYMANVFIHAMKERNFKSTFEDFIPLLAHSSLRFIALGSVLYLLTLAIAIPIRAPLRECEMTKAIQGEMVFYRDVLESR